MKNLFIYFIFVLASTSNLIFGQCTPATRTITVPSTGDLIIANNETVCISGVGNFTHSITFASAFGGGGNSTLIINGSINLTNNISASPSGGSRHIIIRSSASLSTSGTFDLNTSGSSGKNTFVNNGTFTYSNGTQINFTNVELTNNSGASFSSTTATMLWNDLGSGGFALTSTIASGSNFLLGGALFFQGSFNNKLNNNSTNFSAPFIQMQDANATIDNTGTINITGTDADSPFTPKYTFNKLNASLLNTGRVYVLKGTLSLAGQTNTNALPSRYYAKDFIMPAQNLSGCLSLQVTGNIIINSGTTVSGVGHLYILDNSFNGSADTYAGSTVSCSPCFNGWKPLWVTYSATEAAPAGCQTLDLELNYFRLSSDNSKLEWGLFKNEDNFKVEIEKTTDFVDIETMGSLSMPIPMKYSTFNLGEVSETVYYRLKFISAKKVEYSNYVYVSPKIEIKIDDYVNIFPQPASNYINIEDVNNSNSGINVDVLNIGGGIIKSYNLKKQDRNSYNLDLSNIDNGTYLLKIQTLNTKLTKKIVIQK